MKLSKLLATATLALCTAEGAMAVPAYPGIIKVKQADGTTLSIRVTGDERAHCITTEDGYPLLLNEQTGNYEYAVLREGALCSSGMVAADATLRSAEAQALLSNCDMTATVKTALKVSMAKSPVMAAADSTRRAARKRRTLINNFPHTGEQHSIIILMEFNDLSFSAMDDPKQYYNDAMNKEGFTAKNGANGSARDFFIASSDGLFSPTFDVYGPVKVDYGQHDAGQGTNMTAVNMSTLVKAAVQGLDSEVDFSKYDHDGDGFVDNIYIYYAGKGAADTGGAYNLIWPHAANLYSDWGVEVVTDDGVRIGSYTCSNEVDGTRTGNLPAGIGTFVHEFGHCLGFGDHYDSTESAATEKYTPGDWDTMASGSYNNNSNTPPLYSAFERYEMGWLKPEEITHYTDTTNTLPWLGKSNKAFKVSVPGKSNEYFLLENRQLTGWDAYLPAAGMLVWHIDDVKSVWDSNTINTNPNHQYVDIVEANGKPSSSPYTRKGVPFPGSSKVTSHTFTSWAGTEIIGIDNIAMTDSVVTFTVAGAGTNLAKPQPTATAVSHNTVSLAWGAVDNADSYILNVKKVEADGTLTQLAGYNDLKVTATTATVGSLEKLTAYQMTVSSCKGSFYSEPGTLNVTTTDIPFTEQQVTGVKAPYVSAQWFEAEWTPLPAAQSYDVTLSKRAYNGAEVTTAYDFTDKKAGLPEGWTTNSSFYISSDGYFGQAAPALRLTANGNYLTMANGGNMISSLTFWYKVGKAAEGSNVEVQALRYGEWVTEETLDVSADASATVTYTFAPAKQVRLLFNRKSNSNVLIDDVSVKGNSASGSVVEAYNQLNVGNVAYTRLIGLDPETEYSLTVRGICNGQASLPSEEVLVTTVSVANAITTATSDAAGSAATYDLAGRRVSDNAAKGIYLVRKDGKTVKVAR